MRLRFGAAVAALLIASPLLARDIYLGIAGSVGVFRTDTRILNPSNAKDITVTGVFLPVGRDNTTGTISKPITVPKRGMVVLNDVVTSLFAATGLGAIKLSSSDDFVATSRIYAGLTAGTLGQFVPGLEISAAKTKGLLIQLKATGTAGTGTYRTNLGFVNPNASAATLTLYRHDAANAVVDPPQTLSVPPFGVLFPVSLEATAGDFTDSWVSYSSSQPLFGFASVIDNGTTDPTYLTAAEDTGSDAPGTSTRWYLSPILNFQLHQNATAVTSGNKQVCFSPATFATTLQGDLAGTTYKFSLGLGRCPNTGGCVSFNAAGEGHVRADVILKRGSTETVLATNTFNATGAYDVKTATVSGLDPNAQAGDSLLLRLTAVDGQPCIAEANSPGTDHYIETPGPAQ